MRAQLRRLHSPDVDDLRTWSPDLGEPAILVQLMVGPDGSPGEEAFSLTLCTPEWLAQRAEADGIVDGRYHLVITEYDYRRMEQFLQRRVAACKGTTWSEVAAKVASLGRWEFEDYAE